MWRIYPTISIFLSNAYGSFNSAARFAPNPTAVETFLINLTSSSHHASLLQAVHHAAIDFQCVTKSAVTTGQVSTPTHFTHCWGWLSGFFSSFQQWIAYSYCVLFKVTHSIVNITIKPNMLLTCNRLHVRLIIITSSPRSCIYSFDFEPSGLPETIPAEIIVFSSCTLRKVPHLIRISYV